MLNGNSIRQKAAVRLNLEGPLFVQIEDWRRSQFKIPSRSGAILHLVKRALRHQPSNEEGEGEELRTEALK
jgi:hypothetical protein